MIAAVTPLPIVIDPFSFFGDEVAGDTPNEVAKNLGRCVQLSRGKPLRHSPPDLRKIFKGTKLDPEAKTALRTAEKAFQSARRLNP